MKLENQVCTLEQAKKLKEFGVEYETLFAWYEGVCDDEGKPMTYYVSAWHNEAYEQIGVAPAFTVAELGVMLPQGIDGLSWYMRNCWKGFSFGYSGYGQKSIEQNWFDNEARARASLLIQLLETGKTTAAEVNTRLS